MHHKRFFRIALSTAALSACVLAGSRATHAYARIGTDSIGCHPIMTPTGTQYVHTFAFIANASEFPTDSAISDFVEMQRVACTFDDRSHVWDDKWYTAHLSPGQMLIIGFRNMTTSSQDWARILNTESAWYVKSKYNPQDVTLSEGMTKKYMAAPGEGIRLDFDIRNPINTSAADFNNIDYSFGF
jgi:hypothetical protein